MPARLDAPSAGLTGAGLPAGAPRTALAVTRPAGTRPRLTGRVGQSVNLGHYLAIGITVAAPAALVPLARLRPGRWTTALRWLLAAVLLINEVVYQLVQWRGWDRGDPYVFHPWSVTYSLPLWVCDVAALTGAAALVWRRPLLVEITWFWAMAGTLQAIATPDHPIAFFSYDWLEFYTVHIGVVLTALFLVVGLRLHPRPRAAVRVVAVTVGFIALVGVVDALTGGDYEYLHTATPPGLLGVMGPWPWYILGATAVGLLSILVVDLPFWPERRRARHAARLASAEVTDGSAHRFAAPPRA